MTPTPPRHGSPFTSPDLQLEDMFCVIVLAPERPVKTGDLATLLGADPATLRPYTGGRSMTDLTMGDYLLSSQHGRWVIFENNGTGCSSVERVAKVSSRGHAIAYFVNINGSIAMTYAVRGRVLAEIDAPHQTPDKGDTEAARALKALQGVSLQFVEPDRAVPLVESIGGVKLDWAWFDGPQTALRAAGRP
ncbi:MAG: hypothetical protein U0Q15_05565 [Kineosporiaceae bacterium]